MIDLSKYAALFADTARGGIADENVVLLLHILKQKSRHC